ncbi:hypothetical protein ABDK56_04700 [Sphingomonas sp. ASV193]|uniref:hypothetical protein n=1 Tax=Sphingomonas sp. ASV193 TaxID=3144405 RepID=UPI0032E8B390
MSSALHSRGANLVCLGGDLPTLNLVSGFDQGEIDDTFGLPELWGAANWRVGSTTRVGDIQHEHHYDQYRTQARTEMYDDAVSDLDMPYGCQTLFLQDGRGFVGLALLRGRRNGRCKAETLAGFSRLAHFVDQGVRAEMALAGEGAHVALGNYDSISPPLLLLNRLGWLVATSPAADLALDEGDAVRARGRRIAFVDERLDRKFWRIAAALLQPGNAARSISLAVASGAMRALHVARIGGDEDALGLHPSLAVRLDYGPAS